MINPKLDNAVCRVKQVLFCERFGLGSIKHETVVDLPWNFRFNEQANIGRLLSHTDLSIEGPWHLFVWRDNQLVRAGKIDPNSCLVLICDKLG